MTSLSEMSKKSNQPERYKIKVSGLPRFYAMGDPLLQEFLRCIRYELHLNCIYARFVRKGNAWLYLTFPTADEQQNALNALKRYNWKGRTLVSMLVTSDVLKRKTDGSEDEVVGYDSKKQKIDIPISEQVLMSTIPYHSLSYPEQLRQKDEEALSLVCRLHEILMKRGYQLSNWCALRKKQLEKQIPFQLDRIRGSPIIDEYRNKYEFSVGINPDTETVAVGIRVQDRRDGIHHVGPADGLRHLPKPMISLVKVFEKFVLERGDDWDFWYHLIIRINRAGEIMVTVSTNPNKKLLGEEKMESLKDEVRKCFSCTSEKVVSLYFQIHGDKPISETVGIPSKSELLWGQGHIKERLLDLQLEITPVTYFRINSAAAEVLCHSVAELANVDENTTLLDLFCGSGSLALTLASKCKEVIAVELIETNIKDARKYAEINGIKNCEFIAGKIEDIITTTLKRLKGKNVVVILDPPRTGVDQALVKILREFKEATRFIYVCSNHKLPLKNLLDFSALSGNLTDADPIIPVRIIPIDMTPHTLRSELVILCERFDLGMLSSRPFVQTLNEMNGGSVGGNNNYGGRVVGGNFANRMNTFYSSPIPQQLPGTSINTNHVMNASSSNMRSSAGTGSTLPTAPTALMSGSAGSGGTHNNANSRYLNMPYPMSTSPLLGRPAPMNINSNNGCGSNNNINASGAKQELNYSTYNMNSPFQHHQSQPQQQQHQKPSSLYALNSRFPSSATGGVAVPLTAATITSTASSSSSFPPKGPSLSSLYDTGNAYLGGGDTAAAASMNLSSRHKNTIEDYFAEDRYSSLRRDFEKAIDSSYTTSLPSTAAAAAVGNGGTGISTGFEATADFLPMDMVRKIEERAFREGLTRGIQQCAYRVGFELGLRSSAEKFGNGGGNYNENLCASNGDIPGMVSGGGGGSSRVSGGSGKNGSGGSGATLGGNNCGPIGSSRSPPNTMINSLCGVGTNVGNGGNIWDSKLGGDVPSMSMDESFISTWNNPVSESPGFGSSSVVGSNNSISSSNISDNCFRIWNNRTSSGGTGFNGVVGGGNNTNVGNNNSSVLSNSMSPSPLWKP